jgi:CPA2 family monovalent cation:H+ antiporter-2
MGTLSSRVMLGMLVAQDLTFIPLMVILPGLGGGGTGASTTLLSTARAVVLLAFLIAVGTRVFPRLVGWVARSGSRELFLLVTMGIALGIAYLAHWIGVSSAVGAFVAGLVLSESDYSHQALSDIIPLRDVFSLLFFASVGMLLQPGHVLGQWRVIALTAAVVSLVKGGIFWGVTRAFGYRNVVPLASALALFGIGEFSFVLARAGLASGSISEELYALVLNTAVITMVLTPVVSGLTTPVHAWISRRREREPVQTINLPDASLRDHVIVAGAGRVGWQVASVLHALNLPHVLIDLDPRRIDRARDEGRPAIFGDAAQPVVLEAAGASRARLLLVTIPMIGVARAAIAYGRRVNPAISVVVRAENAEAIAVLNSLNVTEVIQPELEASLEMTRQALAHLQMPALEIVHLTDQLRADHYGSAYERYARNYGIVSTIGAAARHLDLRWVRIQEGSALAGRTIGEAAIRTSIGVTIVGMVGAQGLLTNPGADRQLVAGDAVAVVGERARIDAFESVAHPTPRAPA